MLPNRKQIEMKSFTEIVYVGRRECPGTGAESKMEKKRIW